MHSADAEGHDDLTSQICEHGHDEELDADPRPRGHAETLRRGGGRLAHILKGGTWSSATFKEYLSQHDLVRDAMAESIALLSAQPQ